MKRGGELIGYLGGAAAWPLARRGASAQQLKVATIGVLVRGAPGWQQFWQFFPEARRELGYIDRKNVRYEFRSDQGQMSRLPELAMELVQLKVDAAVLARLRLVSP